MPKNRQQLYVLLTERTVPYLDNNVDRFGMGETTPLGIWYHSTFTLKGYNPFVTNFAAWVDPATRTPIITANMNAAEKVLIDYYRELHGILKANPLVTDTDLIAMGFHARSSGGHTPAPVASTPPSFELSTLPDHRLQIDYYDASGETPKKGKPDGQHGVEIRWIFSETPITDADDLSNSVFDTATPAILPSADMTMDAVFTLLFAGRTPAARKAPGAALNRLMFHKF
ncbi:MAG: hypothetical protein LBP25_05135 [Tannerellaceae bacterium]|nr:hypothetical protein [Tannerellaceae bacterium]